MLCDSLVSGLGDSTEKAAHLVEKSRVLQDGAMAREEEIEVKFFDFVEGCGPGRDVALVAANEGDWVADEVADGGNSLFGKPDNEVGWGVALAEVKDLDFAIATFEGERFVDSSGWEW